jgi:DMATS type aromatic prenyltransferase
VEDARHGSPRLRDLVSGQLERLAEVAGLPPADAETYTGAVADALGPVAERSLALPPASPSFLSDDHTPVEFSLAFVPGEAPGLRVLLEPGHASPDLAGNGRAGLAAIHAMAERWQFGTGQLDLLADLFLPPDPEGPLALWCALELRPGGVPGVKVYLNPAANGADRAAETLREALDRLGHHQAFDTLPAGDGYPFLALDLGDWQTPRVKVYVAHRALTAEDAGSLAPGASPQEQQRMRAFFRTVSGFPAPGGDFAASLDPAGPSTLDLLGATGNDADRLFRGRALTCHAFTETVTGLPSGYTLHVPLREYVGNDALARDRTVAVLRSHGMDADALDRALAAVTSRRLSDGVGLVAYVALVHQRGRQPRATVYVSSEAYAVQPPRTGAARARHPVGR